MQTENQKSQTFYAGIQVTLTIHIHQVSDDISEILLKHRNKIMYHLNHFINVIE